MVSGSQLFKNARIIEAGRASISVAAFFRWLIIAVSMAATLIPWVPKMPNTTLDSSWQFAMNEAVARHLVIGTDVIFTFGPYASIYTHLYHPELYALTLLASAYLACLYILCLVTLTDRLRLAHVVAVCLLFVSCHHTPDGVLYTYPLLVGMVVIDDPIREKQLVTTARAALLFSGLGLLLLIKGSLIPLCIGVMALCGVTMAMRRQAGQLVAAAGGACVALLFFWLFAGQPWGALPTYFQTLVPTISGYSDAMALTGSRREVFEYLLGAAAIFFLVWRGGNDSKNRIQVLALLGLFLFIAFKGGMVRHDTYHVINSAAALLLAITLISTRFPSWYAVALAASATALFVQINADWESRPENERDHLLQPYADLFVALSHATSEPGWRERLFSDATAKIKLAHSVQTAVEDIYPIDQAALIVSGGAWRPRPIFQSYGAYTPSLALANRDHLLDYNAPRFVEFAIRPIDGRLPSLEDGASWPVLLTNYRLIETREKRLTLERTGTPTYHDTEIFSKATARIGESVPVPARSGLIWMRMAIRQSLLGKAMSFFYKAPQLEIAVRLSDGTEAVYRLIAGMTQTDFLLSPLVTGTDDFSRLYRPEDIPTDRQVVSFEVRTSSSSSGAWQSNYEVEFRHL